jgi:outer membrane protein assembly factor BamB/formylglycine-generating enzyme required for sulfatase activity
MNPAHPVRTVLFAFLILAATAARPQTPGSVSVRARVVDFGQDFGTWVASPHFRGTADSPRGASALVLEETDLDGNPATPDRVESFPFSLEIPFSTTDSSYDETHTGARFYGGATFLFRNRTGGGITERFINPDHCLDGHFPRDNWALHMFAFRRESPWTAAAVWLWQKKDFLNGAGADETVSIAPDSVIHMREARYWNGYSGVRMLLREGEQFFLSEKTFSGTDLYILKPSETRWAAYNPRAPHDIVFDENAARFEPRSFRNVTAAGFYLFKNTWTPDQGAFKFYAFEFDAVVTRPERPSEHLAMSRRGDFWISNTEIPYATWNPVQTWAENNNYARLDRTGYLFDARGRMGSMEYGAETHSPDEPVTGITFHDAAAWCNALSEREGKTPVYYTDAEHRNIFRFVRQSSLWLKPVHFPTLHVKWDADGYRLPTPREWADSWTPAPLSPAAKTRPVDPATRGNVWEMAWTFDILDPSSEKAMTLLGGSFLSPADPLAVSASPHGERIGWDRGAFDVGFRVVRRAAGGARPSLELPELPPERVWTVAVDSVRALREAPAPTGTVDMVEIPEGTFLSGGGDPVDIRMSAFSMARTEISFAQWRRVRHWAEANGYSFDSPGDRGNMAWVAAMGARGPDQPVSRVSQRDAIAWCNALSELEGLTPIYYEDEAMTRVYRHANRYRPLMIDEWIEDGTQAMRGRTVPDRKTAGGAYMRWNANGYRLPSVSEQTRSLGTLDDAQVWHFGNSGGVTRPVGSASANALGLHDTLGNVMEWTTDLLPAYGRFMRVNPVAESQPSLRHHGTGGMPVGGGSVHHTPASAHIWGPAGGHGINPDLAYPDLGFRVVRSSAYPEGGVTEDNTVQLDLTGKTLDPLTGRTYRYNLQRTGDHATRPLRAFQGLKWQVPLGAQVNSSPIVADGVVYLAADDGVLRAFDAATGAEKWRFKTAHARGPFRQVPTLAEQRVYFNDSQGNVYAIDRADGREIWRAKAMNNSPDSVTLAYGHLFLSDNAGQVVGLRADNGETVWWARRRVRGMFSPRDTVASAVSGATLVSFADYDGYFALDLASGHFLWRGDSSLNGKTSGLGGIADGALVKPVYTAGGVDRIEIPAERLERMNNPVKHVPSVDGQKRMGGGGVSGHEIQGAAALRGHIAYAAGMDGFLRAFDTREGKRLWELDLGEPIGSSVTLAGDVLYCGGENGGVFAVGTDGKRLSTTRVEGAVTGSPWILDGVLYVVTRNGTLWALE